MEINEIENKTRTGENILKSYSDIDIFWIYNEALQIYNEETVFQFWNGENDLRKYFFTDDTQTVILWKDAQNQ